MSFFNLLNLLVLMNLLYDTTGNTFNTTELFNCIRYESCNDKCYTMHMEGSLISIVYNLSCMESGTTCDDSVLSNNIHHNFDNCIDNVSLSDVVNIDIMYMCSNSNPYVELSLDIDETSDYFDYLSDESIYCGILRVCEDGISEYSIECSGDNIFSGVSKVYIGYMWLYMVIYGNILFY
jgi:hypothetical protein